jgi:hypothetical protein
MRTYVLAIVSAFALPASAPSQAVEFGPSGVNAYSYHRHYECRSIAASVPPQGRARQARPRQLPQISRSLPKGATFRRQIDVLANGDTDGGF